MEFSNMLSMVIREMGENNAELCLASYSDNCFYDNAIVMFMDLGNYSCVHEAMQVLHDRLSAHAGYPVSICHNHPTDESILIHGSLLDSRVYDMHACCKDDIDHGMKYLATRTGYRNEIQAMARAAEALGDARTVLEGLDWNAEPTVQLIDLLVGTKKTAFSNQKEMEETIFSYFNNDEDGYTGPVKVYITCTPEEAGECCSPQKFTFEIDGSGDYNFMLDFIDQLNSRYEKVEFAWSK